MIAAAGNNKTPTLRNYWPASLTLDKSNNAHYPHVPLYSRTSEGAEAANEIFAAQEAEWADGYDWLEEDFLLRRVMWPLALSHTPAISSFFFFSLFFFLAPLFYFSWYRLGAFGMKGEWGGESRKSSNDTMRQSMAAWIHDRQKPQTFATGSELTRCERERQTERERGRDNVLWLPLNIQWSSCNLSMIFTFIFVIMCF